MRIVNNLLIRYRRFRKCLSMIRHQNDYVDNVSYYPDCEHKTKKEILKDQLHFMWKYGEAERFYYLYGFDRKEMDRDKMEGEYIMPYKSFIKKVNHLNYYLPFYSKDMCQYTGRAIIGDKFYFYLFLSRLGVPTPKIYCYIKDGRPLFFDDSLDIDKGLSDDEKLDELLKYEMDAFAKPSDGECGHGVFFLKITCSGIYMNDKKITSGELKKILLSANYIVQDRVKQHSKIGALCSSTLNTIRIQTVKAKDGSIIPFGPGLRIGRNGGIVDNWAQGGIFVGINENGTLMKYGYYKPQYGSITTEHPDSKIVFDGYEIPYFDEIVRCVTKLHNYLYRCHSIGWDVAITENGPVLIEGNSLWEISLVQAVHGGLKYLETNFNY